MSGKGRNTINASAASEFQKRESRLHHQASSGSCSSCDSKVTSHRPLASDCLAIARTTADPAARTVLLSMAQRWYDLANGSALNDAITREFSDWQMSDTSQPVLQQQQQIKPNKKE
jgi:hypothetical protein